LLIFDINFLEQQTDIVFYDATVILLFFRIAAHQKCPNIFQLLDKLENVAEKIPAE
jgi:hypothetical protein